MTPAGVKEFVHAIRTGDLERVRSLATASPGVVNATDPGCFGATPLIHAVNTDRIAMVDLLLELGAEIDKRSDWQAGSFGVLDSAGDAMSDHLLRRGATLTPHAAARLGKVAELRGMLAADPSIVRARGGDGQFPLHFARTVEIADLLLAHGAEIDAVDIDHASTAAQWLATSRPEVAAHLVMRGAALDPFLAVRTGDLGLLEEAVAKEPRGLSVRITRERFRGPAPAAGHIYLFTMGENFTLVHTAAQAGLEGVIRWLSARGADVNARGGYDQGTPLHFAAWDDRGPAVEALIEAGADMEVESGHVHDNEPIGWAIVGGSKCAFDALRRAGAKVHPHHAADAKLGAQGAFRTLKPKLPIEVWRAIAGELGC